MIVVQVQTCYQFSIFVVVVASSSNRHSSFTNKKFVSVLTKRCAHAGWRELKLRKRCRFRNFFRSFISADCFGSFFRFKFRLYICRLRERVNGWFFFLTEKSRGSGIGTTLLKLQSIFLLLFLVLAQMTLVCRSYSISNLLTTVDS